MLDLAEGREPCPPQFLSSTEDSKEENPAYTNWIKRDQTFLTWINATLSESLLRYAMGYTSGLALWLDLETRLAENATSRVQELKHRLINLNKTTTIGAYIQSAKQIADDLEAAGFPVDDAEYVSCILKGLPSAYDKFKASIKVDRPEPLTRETLHGLLQSYTTTCDNILFTIAGLVILGIMSSPLLVALTLKFG